MMNEISQLNQPSRLRRIVFAVVCLGAFFLFLIGVSLFFSRHWFVAEILNSFRFQISISIMISGFFLYACRTRAWALIQILLGIAVIWPVVISMLPASQPEPGNTVVTVLSYNVLGQNSNPEPVINTIRDQSPDILLVIEYATNWEATLREVTDQYPFSVREPRWHGFGIGLFSRFEIADFKVHQITKDVTDNPLLVAEIVVGEESVFVVGGHFLAPMTIEKMEIRNRQFAETAGIISEIIDRDQHANVIFIGDLNCVPWSPNAVDLMKANQMRDSRQGYFYQGSWPTENILMCIPIDNAFVTERVSIQDRRILPADSSDHYPLHLKFSIGQ